MSNIGIEARAKLNPNFALGKPTLRLGTNATGRVVARSATNDEINKNRRKEDAEVTYEELHGFGRAAGTGGRRKRSTRRHRRKRTTRRHRRKRTTRKR